MANLGSYYGLCPLIDSKNLLGISEDPERGVVIVTLGKNIACRYKLSDQKQISSWKTKEKFSSPVIYDRKLSTYLAVFNQSYIKTWNADETNLDKLKKYKFRNQICSLISEGESTFILFQNGAICTLTDALEMRRDLNPEHVISDVEQIEDILYQKLNDHLYVGMIVRSSNDELYLYWAKCISEKYKFSKVKLFREGLSLRGCVFHSEGTSVYLLTLWSDGRIFSYPLQTDEVTLQELFATVETISTKYSVSMLSLDENYIVMYGANRNEEGAILIIYNTQFKVIQSTQPFKLFTNGAKLWRIENYLLLPVGQNLAVIPFFLETEQLAALVGSHKTTQNEKDEDISIVQELEVASWNIKANLKDTQISKSHTFKMSELLKQGLPESIIIGEILQDIFKQHDVDSLFLCIKNFSDIPEKYLVDILKYVLTLESTLFSKREHHSSKLFPPNLQPAARSEIIDLILCKSFNETLLIPHLRSQLALKEVLSLIEYICFLWSEDGHTLPSSSIVKSEAKLINWSYVLVDSSYQKFLLSKNESIKSVLTELLELTKQHLSSFSDLKIISNILARHKSKECKVINVKLKYSIEQINLY